MKPNRTATSFAAAFAALALAACVSEPSSVSTSETLMAIHDGGVGPINAETPYSEKAIAAALPGFEVKPVQATVNGNVSWILAGFYDGFQTLRFVAGPGRKTVAEVQVISEIVRGPNGERIGMTFRESRGSRFNCVAGSNEWTGMAVCTGDGGRMRYVYTVESYRGSGGLPSRDELNDARLTRMVWHAGR